MAGNIVRSMLELGLCQVYTRIGLELDFGRVRGFRQVTLGLYLD